MKTFRNLCGALLALSFFIACVTPNPLPSPVNSPLIASTSPVIDIVSPIATRSVSIEVVPFILDKPIVEGVTRVTGRGPAGVPIFVADVTFMGDILGVGTINADGSFAVDVPTLERNHRIGVTIADLSGTVWIPEDFYDQGFQGPDAMQAPQAGFYYDTAMVQAP